MSALHRVWEGSSQAQLPPSTISLEFYTELDEAIYALAEQRITATFQVPSKKGSEGLHARSLQEKPAEATTVCSLSGCFLTPSGLVVHRPRLSTIAPREGLGHPPPLPGFRNHMISQIKEVLFRIGQPHGGLDAKLSSPCR